MDRASTRTHMRQSTRGGLALGLALVGLGLLGFNRTRVAGWTVSDLAVLVTAVVICLRPTRWKLPLRCRRTWRHR